MAGLNPCAVEAEGETNTPIKPRNAAPAPSLMVKENVMARLPGFMFGLTPVSCSYAFKPNLVQYYPKVKDAGVSRIKNNPTNRNCSNHSSM